MSGILYGDTSAIETLSLFFSTHIVGRGIYIAIKYIRTNGHTMNGTIYAISVIFMDNSGLNGKRI